MPNRNDITISPTRYPELGIARIAGHIWRYVAKEPGDTFDPYGNCVGASYRTKREALADLDRFASDYGATGAHKPADLRLVPINGAWSTGRKCPVCGAATGAPCINASMGCVHAARDCTAPMDAVRAPALL